MRKYYIRFLARLHAPVRRLRVFFSRFLLRGTQERTLRRTLGPRPGSVARALGVQSRASWLFFNGLRSASPSLAVPWKPRNLWWWKNEFRRKKTRAFVASHFQSTSSQRRRRQDVRL